MNSITLSQAFEGFILDSAVSKSQNTIRNYRNTLKKVLLFFADQDPQFQSVTREDWVKFLNWLQDDYVSTDYGVAPRKTGRTLSPKSINNIHTNLSAFYSWAMKSMGLVEKNIIRTIPAPRYEKPLIQTFTRDDITAMLKACDYTHPWHSTGTRGKRPTAVRDRAIIHVLLSTGIRASELCNIRFKDINMNDQTIHVAGKGRGRDSKPRVVHFGQICKKALWKHILPQMSAMKSEDYVFTVGFNDFPSPMTRQNLYKLLLAIGKRAGVKDVHPHRFRHTFATEYIRNGGDSFKLRILLGHSSMEMVNRYVHLVKGDCRSDHAASDPADNWRIR